MVEIRTRNFGRLAAAALALTLSYTAAAQQGSLKAELETAVRRADSLANVLDGMRARLRVGDISAAAVSATEAELLSAQALAVDLRRRAGAAGEAKNESAAAAGTASDAAGLSSSRLSWIGPIASALNPEDLAALRRAEDSEAQIAGMIGGLSKSAEITDRLTAAYMALPTQDGADSLHQEISASAREYRAALESISARWRDDIYQVKQFAYAFVMDRLDMTAAVRSAESMLSQIGGREDELGEGSAEIRGYIAQKEYIIGIERLICSQVGASAAADSLSEALTALRGIKIPAESPQEPAWHDGIEYARSTYPATTAYGSRNPIPEKETEPLEDVWSIYLGRFQSAQPVSVARGVSPVFYVRDSERRLRYLTGTYARREWAEADIEMLTKRGFKAPQVMSWAELADLCEGAPAAAPHAGSAQTGKDQAVRFHVRISYPGTSLPSEVRAAVLSTAPGKEISRAAQDGGYVFSVGPFQSREEAQKVSDGAREALPALNVTVTEAQ